MISFKIDVNDDGDMSISSISEIDNKGVSTDITNQIINPEDYKKVMSELFTPANQMTRDWYRMAGSMGRVLKSLCMKIDNAKISSKFKNDETGKFHPTSNKELRTIITSLVDQQGYKANLNVIDVSAITDFSGIFSRDYRTNYNMTEFDGDISNWDVSNAIKMDSMFEGSKCNCNLSKWKTGKVKSVVKMFYWARGTSINSIENWDVSNVEDFTSMLEGDPNWINYKNSSYANEINFMNLDLSNWNVSNAKFMTGMLRGNIDYTGKGLENWDVSNVVDMSNMFIHDRVFNGDVSNWNVSNLVNAEGMFRYCETFNKPLNWNTSNLSNADRMFENAKSFNGNISNWDVRKLKTAHSMFSYANNFEQDLSKWRLNKLEDGTEMFYKTQVNFDASNWMIDRRGVKKAAFTYIFFGSPMQKNLPDWWYKLTRHKKVEENISKKYNYNNIYKKAIMREKFSKEVNNLLNN